MKSAMLALLPLLLSSLPVRGAWVEIAYTGDNRNKWFCRSPCGERGLKSKEKICKYCKRHLSLPVRGAWVEIA